MPWNLPSSPRERPGAPGLAANRSDTELAAEFGVDSQVIFRLRDHFERYGLHSIMGQD